MKILVSACLLGKDCKYNGKNNYKQEVIGFCQGKDCIPICPEELGGLPTPREPSEIIGDRVVSSSGRDVTEEFKRGARRSLKLALEHGAQVAILKNRSPSCGCGEVYDGSFAKALRPGNGITSQLFLENGISVYSESDLEAVQEKEEE